MSVSLRKATDPMPDVVWNSSVRTIRAYLQANGLSLPSRLRKSDLTHLKNVVRYDTLAGLLQYIAHVPGVTLDVEAYGAACDVNASRVADYRNGKG